MAVVGSESTRLIIIRGNSASGKTTAAWEIRKRFGYGLAIVSQDVLRREILRAKDNPNNPAVGLIDLTARYALDCGYHVVVEGILSNQNHGQMLTNLVRDHAGISAAFYYDLDFEETVRRHASKSQSVEYGREMMSRWYREQDLIPPLNETIFAATISQDEAVARMMTAVGLPSANERNST